MFRPNDLAYCRCLFGISGIGKYFLDSICRSFRAVFLSRDDLGDAEAAAAGRVVGLVVAVRDYDLRYAGTQYLTVVPTPP